MWTLCTKLYARAYTGGSTPGAARSGGAGASTVRPFLFLGRWGSFTTCKKTAHERVPASCDKQGPGCKPGASHVEGVGVDREVRRDQWNSEFRSANRRGCTPLARRPSPKATELDYLPRPGSAEPVTGVTPQRASQMLLSKLPIAFGRGKPCLSGVPWPRLGCDSIHQSGVGWLGRRMNDGN